MVSTGFPPSRSPLRAGEGRSEKIMLKQNARARSDSIKVDKALAPAIAQLIQLSCGLNSGYHLR